ncbi:hypothetical protein SS50377_25286 [Spironucleus salmonicida]|uniref:Uncharacterized protein n=1 Tax=Spironucleus salmonicida TaxID=348837 RepID=V6LC72_9EUKA|nr:hypothetical protein SS50377_25286 [Spironucleus salmonicida]|eukprot:EST41833.1 Hypothetical protein SS50377_18667 [Spironucleus salmonicida]
MDLDISSSSSEFLSIHLILQAATNIPIKLNELVRFPTFKSPKLIFIIPIEEFLRRNSIKQFILNENKLLNGAIQAFEMKFSPTQESKEFIIYTGLPMRFQNSELVEIELKNIVLLYKAKIQVQDQYIHLTQQQKLNQTTFYSSMAAFSENQINQLTSLINETNKETIKAESQLANIYQQSLKEVQLRSQFSINMLESMKLGFQKQKTRIEKVINLVGLSEQVYTDDNSTSIQCATCPVDLFNEKTLNFNLKLTIVNQIKVDNNFSSALQQNYISYDSEQLHQDAQDYLQFQSDQQQAVYRSLTASYAIQELQKTLNVSGLDSESLKKRAKEELKQKLESSMSQSRNQSRNEEIMQNTQNESQLEVSQLQNFTKKQNITRNNSIKIESNFIRNNQASLILSGEHDTKLQQRINVQSRVLSLNKKINYKPEITNLQDIPLDIQSKYNEYFTILCYQFSKQKNDSTLKLPIFIKRRNYNSGNMLVVLFNQLKNNDLIAILVTTDNESICFLCYNNLFLNLGTPKISVQGIESELLLIKGKTLTFEGKSETYEKGVIFDVE